jgi:WD40 repeat protein
MTVKVLVDLSLSPDWVLALQRHGWQAIAILLLGANPAFDPSIKIDSSTNGSAPNNQETKAPQVVVTLRPHDKSVRLLAFSPDSKWLASVSYDESFLETWEVTTGKRELSFKAHDGPIKAVAYAPDGNSIATGSKDGTVKIWDSRNGKLVKTLPKKNPVWGIAFSPNGKKLAAAGGDKNGCGRLVLWDIAQGKELYSVAPHRLNCWSVAFSPDGTRIATSSRDGTVKVMRADNGKTTLALEGDYHLAAFSPDGKLLATLPQEGPIRFWSLPSGKECGSLKTTYFGACISYYHTGRFIAVGGLDRPAEVWDVKKKEKILLNLGHAPTDLVASIAFSPDGKLLAAAWKRVLTKETETTIRIWDVAFLNQIK